MVDITTEGRELLIATDGRVVRSPVPDGFAPQMFRHIVAGVDMLYRRNGAMPTINEVMATWDEFDKATISKAWVTDEFKKALEIRGIDFDMKAGLTAEQLYAIQILQDPTDRRSTKTKLEAVGISIGKYRAWMRNRVFAAAMNSQAEQNLGDSVQMALNKLVANAESGDQRAIEKILEISGRWNPQQQEIQNARTVVMVVMEVIQSELAGETEKLDRILSKVRSRMAAMSVTQVIKEIQ